MWDFLINCQNIKDSNLPAVREITIFAKSTDYPFKDFTIWFESIQQIYYLLATNKIISIFLSKNILFWTQLTLHFKLNLILTQRSHSFSFPDGLRFEKPSNEISQDLEETDIIPYSDSIGVEPQRKVR